MSLVSFDSFMDRLLLPQQRQFDISKYYSVKNINQNEENNPN